MIHLNWKSALIAGIAIVTSSFAHAFETKATAAYVLDQTTGTVLLNKNAEQPMPPASMSKLMTLYMTFEALKDGRLRWDEKLPVSQHAMDYSGSTMFLNTTDQVTVENLVRGIIVLSGNDACAVLAEALSVDGTEAGFARMMTNRAHQLGMTSSTFANSNGWPNPGQRMSMKDLAILADLLIKEYPAYYALFSQSEFKFDGRAPANTRNRNPLLGLNFGADGLKTGHTKEAGYGLVGSAKQGDRRIIFVITGLDSNRSRAEESKRIVNWAFRQFQTKTLGEEGQILAEADVWMGAKKTVGLTMAGAPTILIPAKGLGQASSHIEYYGPLQAPISKGDTVAELVIRAEGIPEARFALSAANDVEKGGFFPRISGVASILTNRLGTAINGAM